MSLYRNECSECDSAYETECWEPEECPICAVEKKDIEIDRLTRELAEARRLIELQGVAQTMMVEDAFADAVERIANVQRVRWVDCATGEYMEGFRGITRTAASQGISSFFGLLRMWTCEQERDAALRDNAALRAMMPSTHVVEKIAAHFATMPTWPLAEGPDAEAVAWNVREVHAWLSRLSPPSAPAQDATIATKGGAGD